MGAIVIIGALFFFFGVKSDESEQELEEIARDTYQFFEDYTDERTGLTADRVDFEGEPEIYRQTSPTNIAMYLASVISAHEFAFLSKEEAQDKIERTLKTLNEMETWNGLYYNWYFTNNGALMSDWGEFISTVDNGWLTAALVVVGQYFPELAHATSSLIDEMDYSSLYDVAEGKFRGGFDALENKLTDHHYGLLYSETRITSYVAIGKGDVPTDHWWKLDRTMPKKYGQAQEPQGEIRTYDNIEVFAGHYTYEDLTFVPSWGGSMFEALMPGLFMHEKKLGKKGLGLNNERHVAGQIKYAEEKGYDVWGFSPSSIVEGYKEFGAPILGTEGYDDEATVTPHASLLALEYDPEAVLENIEKLKDLGLYGKYGFYDSIQLTKDEVAKSYLALDQGMILLSITNYLHDDVIRNQFHEDPIGKTYERLLSEEVFLIDE